MATATLIQQRSTLDYTPTVDTPAGTIVVLNQLVGVATRPLKANQPGTLQITGVFDFPKDTGTGTGSGAGVNIYWAEADDVATRDINISNLKIGKAARSATDTDTTWRVLLTP